MKLSGSVSEALVVFQYVATPSFLAIVAALSPSELNWPASVIVCVRSAIVCLNAASRHFVNQSVQPSFGVVGAGEKAGVNGALFRGLWTGKGFNFHSRRPSPAVH